MAFARVQTLQATSSAVANAAVAAAFGSNVTTGNRLLMFTTANDAAVGGAGADIGTPTKSAGTSTVSAFTQLTSASIVSGSSKIYMDVWTATVTTGGTCTLSASVPVAGGSELGWTAAEYSGLDMSAGTGCLDKSANGTGNSANTSNIATGTTAATTGANQLGLCMVGDWGSGTTWTLSTANGFTKVAGLSQDLDANATMAVAEKTSASGATESATWTNGGTSDTDNACVVVIKLAAGGAATVQPHPLVVPSRAAQQNSW